jgi:fibronectin-binding autotransporter adhesin
MTTSQNGIASGTGSYTVAAQYPYQSTLSVDSVANAGSASTLGSSSSAAANLVLDRAVLRHTGASSSTTDRLFTIGAGGATLESTGAGAVTYGSAGGTNAIAGASFRTLTLGGASTAANTISSILANGTGGEVLSLVKADAGTWVLGGDNTYTGTTAVLAGTLLVNGNQSGGFGAISVATNAVLGGSGTMGGNMTFGSGALFAFNATSPLSVSGSVTFASAATFGVSSLTGLTSSVADATYPLIAGNVNLTNLANFGSSNAYDLGSGKAAYFEALSPSGLSLVVVPEPTSIAAAIASLGLMTLVLRRRRE